MPILTKAQERILRHIISIPKNAQNTVSIGNQMSTYPKDIDDKELIQVLTYLEQIDFIKIKWTSVHHDNLNYAVDITLLPNGNGYFHSKRHMRFKNIGDNIKWLLPSFISILSLIWNIYNTIYGWYLNDLINP